MTIPNLRVKSALFPLFACLIALLSPMANAAPDPVKASPEHLVTHISKSLPRWAVTPENQTIRQTVARWASEEGWSFPNENWVPNVDVPIIGTAIFQGGFIEAVQGLVATTELTDTPLQPCFYQNKVVRVLYFNQSCDKMSEQ